MMQKKHFFSLACLALLCLVSGCGQNFLAVHPATGSVEFDQEIPVDMTLVFHPVNSDIGEGEPYYPRAVVREDGKFQLTTYNTYDGAPEGEYKVVLSWQGKLQGLDEDEIDRLPELVPPKYRSVDTTDIVVHISAGDNELEKIVLVSR